MDILLRYDNLIYRKPTLDDVNDLINLKNNKKASLLLGGNTPFYTKEMIIKWVEFHNNKKDELLLVVYDEISKKLIGHIGLYNIDFIAKKAEYGILLADDDSRGKGYGTNSTKVLVEYAFNKLNLHKIYAEVIAENKASVAMFKKCGFRIDGILRDDIFKNRRFYNVYNMSILNGEEK